VNPEAQRLAAALQSEPGPLLVLTGAGVSAASGLATFRGTDPKAIWNVDVKVLASEENFRRNPVESWTWFRRHFARVPLALPNPAHHALASLEALWTEKRREFLLVTQNIDTLHEKAGSVRLVKVHGSADRVRCSREACAFGGRQTLAVDEIDFDAFDRDPSREALPRCSECGSLIRPHALLFDEWYSSHPDYQWDRVQKATRTMRTLLCVGTSFSVGVTHHVLVDALTNRVPIFVIDPRELSDRECAGGVHLRGKAEELLPATCDLLAKGAAG
jgi:NAD-dependent deacetylase